MYPINLQYPRSVTGEKKEKPLNVFHQQVMGNRLAILQTDLISKENQKKWKILPASLGTAIMLVAAPLILFSPYLSKHTIPKLLASNHSWIKRPFFKRWLEHFEGNKKALLNATLRLSAIGNLFLYVSDYQVGLNTQQPSKLFSRHLAILTSLLSLKFPAHLLLRILGLAGMGLLTAGSRNDIENYNHLESRRELKGSMGDLFFSKKAFRYIADDLRHSLSLEPWQDLSKYLKQKTFHKPASAQSALASQFYFLSAIMGLGAVLTKSSVAKNIILERLTLPVTFTSGLLANIPVFMRGWESRHEADGKMVLLGIPVMLAGQVFTLSNERYHLIGLNNIGGAIFTSNGMYLTSRKHHFLVTYLNSLHQLAQTNPVLMPSDVATFLNTHPVEREQLRRKIGKVRLNFIMQLMRQAERQMGSHSISFASFMNEVVSAHDQNVLKSQVPQPHEHKKIPSSF